MRLQFQLEAKEAYLMGSDEYEKCFLCGDYMTTEASVKIMGETVCTDNCIGGVIEEGESVHEMVMKHQRYMGRLRFDMRVYTNEILSNINKII